MVLITKSPTLAPWLPVLLNLEPHAVWWSCQHHPSSRLPYAALSTCLVLQERRSESADVRPFDHVYQYVKLDVPEASVIKRLQDFTGASLVAIH